MNKKNNKGMAMVEALPIIMVMFVLMGATLGSWGIVHTAILNSIASRNAIFFYFNNRSDLSYLRDFFTEYGLSPDTGTHYFRKDGDNGMGKRFTFIVSEKATLADDGMVATLRKVDFRDIGTPVEVSPLSNDDHSNIPSITPDGRNTGRQTGKISEQRNRAWIMVGYGICLDAECGGSP